MSDKSASGKNSTQPHGKTTPGRNFAVILTVLTASILFAALLIEITFRIFPTLQPMGIERSEFCKGEPFRDSPNSVFFESPHRADGWKLHVNNALGFRDVFDTGPVKVIVLGDSFTRGTATNNGEFYGDLLDLWTPETGIRTFGHGGWGTGDQLLQYRAIADTTPHELVVLGYYPGNDLTDNPKHGFSLQDGKILGPLAPVRPAEVERVKSTGQRIRGVLAKMEIYRFLKHYYYLLFERKPQQEEIERNSDALLKLSLALIEELTREVADNGAKLLVFSIPSRNELRIDDTPNFITAQYEMLEIVATKHDNVEWIDLRPVFAEYDPQKTFAVDGHLARFGHFLVADALADRMGITPSEFQQDDKFKIVPDCDRVDEYIQKLEVFGPGKSR